MKIKEPITITCEKATLNLDERRIVLQISEEELKYIKPSWAGCKLLTTIFFPPDPEPEVKLTPSMFNIIRDEWEVMVNTKSDYPGPFDQYCKERIFGKECYERKENDPDDSKCKLEKDS